MSNNRQSKEQKRLKRKRKAKQLRRENGHNQGRAYDPQVLAAYMAAGGRL